MQQLLSLGELPAEPLQPLMEESDAVEARVLAAQLLQLGRVPRDLGVGQLLGDFLRPRERLAESRLHGSAGRLVRPVFLTEPLHTAGRVDQLLLAGEERVALGADFDVDHGDRGARDEAVAARALHGCSLIGRMNPGFHCSHP